MMNANSTLKQKIKTVKRLTMTSSIALMMGLSAGQMIANAADKSFHFDMSAMPLSEALVNFSEKTNIVVLAPNNVIGEKMTLGLQGNYSPAEAIKILLFNNDVAFEFKDENTIIMRWVGSDNAFQNAGYQTISFNTDADYEKNFSAYEEDDEREEVSGGVFDEIIVTATKRAVSAQDVGISLLAITAEMMSRNSVTDIRDIGRLAAGVEFTGGSNGVDPFVVIRGVSLQATGPANAPSNAVHVDEVPYTRSQFLNFPTFDLERVEILKGPQGTLFGLAATGGTVNLITKKPTQEQEGYINVRYGRFNEVDITAAYSGAVTDKISARLAVKYQRSDGHQKSIGNTNIDRSKFAALASDQFDFTSVLADPKFGVTAADLLPGGFVQDSYENLIASIPDIAADDNFGGLDKFAVRAGVVAELADNVEMFLQFSYFTDDSEIIQRELEGVNGTFIGTDGQPLRDRAGNPLPTEKFVVAHNIEDPTIDHDQFGFMLRFDIDLDFATLTTVTGFNDVNRVIRDNTDTTSLPAQEQFMTTDDQVITQEIRLVSDGESDLFWTVGVFFLNDQLSAIVDTPFAFKSANRLGGSFFTAYTEDVVHWATFANIEYSLTEQLRLVGGLRFNNENRQYNVIAFDNNPFGFRNAEGFTLLEETSNRQLPLERATTVHETSTTWKIGAEWRPTDDILVFANVAQGHSAAGFDGSAVTSLTEAINPISGETVTTYEIGFKSEFPDYNIRFNGAIFFSDYKDIRISVQEKIFLGIFDPVTGEELFTQGGSLQNAGAAEVQGAEFEINWVPSEYFGVDARVNILDTEITEFTGNVIANSPESIAAILGSKLPDAPDLTYNIGLWADFPVSSDFRIKASVNYIYRDDAFTRTVTEDVKKLIESYDLVNARIDFMPEEEQWSIGIWARNLFDQDYAVALDGGEGANGFRRITRGMPRTVGVELNYNF